MSFEAMGIVRGSGLTDGTVVDVLEALAFFLNAKTDKCCPSTEKIALIARKSPNIVRKTIKFLEKEGLITTSQREGKLRYFTINFDRIPKGCATEEPLTDVQGVTEVQPLAEVTLTPCRSERGPLSEVKAEQGMEQGKNKEISNTRSEPPSKGEFSQSSYALSTRISDQTWADWTKQRKRKRAVVTQRVLDSLTSEAEKAGLTLERAMQIQVERGWTGFRSEWVNRDKYRQVTGPASELPQSEKDFSNFFGGHFTAPAKA